MKFIISLRNSNKYNSYINIDRLRTLILYILGLDESREVVFDSIIDYSSFRLFCYLNEYLNDSGIKVSVRKSGYKFNNFQLSYLSKNNINLIDRLPNKSKNNLYINSKGKIFRYLDKKKIKIGCIKDSNLIKFRLRFDPLLMNKYSYRR